MSTRWSPAASTPSMGRTSACLLGRERRAGLRLGGPREAHRREQRERPGRASRDPAQERHEACRPNSARRNPPPTSSAPTPVKRAIW